MDRVNKILNNEKYKDYLKKNNFYEKNREFCKHDSKNKLYTLLGKGVKCK